MSARLSAIHRPVSARPGLTPLRLLGRFAEIRRQRRALATLDEHMLQDIGITRAQAQAEAERPVWDAPAHWLTRP